MFTRKFKIIIAAVVIGLSAGYLLYEAASSSWVYYYSVDEFINNQALIHIKDEPAKITANPVIRVAGIVKQGSIVENAEKNRLVFELAGSKADLAVQYNGPLPNNFADAREVIVEGKAARDGFLADKILTRCESKYKVKLNPDSNKI